MKYLLASHSTSCSSSTSTVSTVFHQSYFTSRISVTGGLTPPVVVQSLEINRSSIGVRGCRAPGHSPWPSPARSSGARSKSCFAVYNLLLYSTQNFAVGAAVTRHLIVRIQEVIGFFTRMLLIRTTIVVDPESSKASSSV
jgi:hypothetical protein